MTINDINSFAINNNVYLSKEELDFIYNYIKDNYLLLINSPNNFDLTKYKNRFSNDNYYKINKIINEYKKKYNIN